MDESKLNEADKVFIELITNACMTIKKIYGPDICERLMDEYLIAEDSCECSVCDLSKIIAQNGEEERRKVKEDFEQYLQKVSDIIHAMNELREK